MRRNFGFNCDESNLKLYERNEIFYCRFLLYPFVSSKIASTCSPPKQFNISQPNEQKGAKKEIRHLAVRNLIIKIDLGMDE